MGKLTQLKPRLAALPPRLGYAPGDKKAEGRYRQSTQPATGWYNTARWQRLRWTIWVRDNFTCRLCGRTTGKPGELVCDHVTPHKGNREAFWRGPFQTLCKPCHDGMKQREERHGRNNLA